MILFSDQESPLDLTRQRNYWIIRSLFFFFFCCNSQINSWNKGDAVESSQNAQILSRSSHSLRELISNRGFLFFLRRIYDRKSSLCRLNLGPVKSRRLTAAAVRLLSRITDIQRHMQGWHCCSLNYISVWTREEESLVSLLLI